MLAKAVKALRRNNSGSDRLLVHRSGHGWHEVRAEDLNDRFKELAGDDERRGTLERAVIRLLFRVDG
ncbi:hypothetical protein YIM_26420 [Amycolatopsis sp. YIM 10]|nr:hypothetical protein YIM_26420 [Amycolatopsis sp. YIM 10]